MTDSPGGTAGSGSARWRGLWRTRWAELRTAATGVDPGLVRLRLATGALLSIVLALALAVGLQQLTGEQPTVVIMAAVLAMVSNIAVNETAIAAHPGHDRAAGAARHRRPSRSARCWRPTGCSRTSCSS